MIVPRASRGFATASIRDRFETAYVARREQMNKGTGKVQGPVDKERYGKSYYQDKLSQMRTGYVHPYHTEQSPLVYTHYNYIKTLFEAVGPEHVSPHYESFARSRRGLIFLFAYIGTITSVSKLGGWSHNEWIRGMIFHHEFMIGFYLGWAEIRHFFWLPGPKFSVFYDVYSMYEMQQLGAQWADVCEEQQMTHLTHTKEQMEYVRLNKEYDFVKKRAMVNFLTNSRTDLENHFHSRAVNMLGSIERFEQSNLKNLLNGIGSGALQKVKDSLANPESAAAIKEASFQSALQGIRDGSMTYKNDPLMPILTNEINDRVSGYKALNSEEEGKLLSLNADQKKIISEADKRDKQAFLSQMPNINNPGVKVHPKFTQYVESVKATH